MAAMHQDTSEDREVVAEKLNEVFGVRVFFTFTYIKDSNKCRNEKTYHEYQQY